ncbi:MAG: TonB-dependent receptor [Bacteroidota bacterium]
MWVFSRFLLFSCCLSWSLTAFAQASPQTIRGQVLDSGNRQALVGANVVLQNVNRNTITDSLGRFRIADLAPGRYDLAISYVGYGTYNQVGLLVESGKEVVLEIELTPIASSFDEVVVSGAVEQGYSSFNSINQRSITVEETARFPATFFDPARLAASFPGVAGDNDQANGLSIRGNSPNNMSWWLEGVQIVNPNHTPNAGTFNDRVTQNGGGVNMLSAQLLGLTRFYSGAFPTAFGNAVGGVLDMRLRNGNNEQLEFTGQAGLIGLDLAVEGPFSKQSDASYLVNYRYSTIGLLSSLGVPLGDEEINFQDLAFHLVFPLKNGNKIRVFGLGGRSENIFEAERDSTQWEFEKDGFDINFESQMGALGAVFTVPMRNGFWNTSLVGSGLESTRTALRLDQDFTPQQDDFDELIQSKIAVHSWIQQQFSNQFAVQYGLLTSREYGEVRTLENGDEVLADDSISGWLVQPYVNVSYQFSDRFSVQLGGNAQYFSTYESLAIGPRLLLRYRFGARQYVELSGGRFSQLQPFQLSLSNANIERQSDLDFTNSNQVELSYSTSLKEWGNLRLQTYYQRLDNVPVTSAPSSFSALNYLSGVVNDRLVNEGEGENYGVELSLSRQLQNNYYFLFSSTLYESRYQGSDGVWRDTRYNGNYIFNLTGGREKQWERSSGEVYSLGLNARIVYSGGFRETPIDLVGSEASGTTIFQDELAFTEQQQDYFRIDFRVYYKRNKDGYSSTLALDVQNLTNQENVAFSYFDTRQNKVLLQEQLGIIPVLSYKIEF